MDIDYLTEPAGDCIRWMTKHGSPSHYCFSIPYANCPKTPGCQHSQSKPAWKRMQNKYRTKLEND